MTITDSTLGYVGLFGYTLNGVVIQNVHLTDVSINISGAERVCGRSCGFHQERHLRHGFLHH